MNNSERDCDVVVIGAGLGGLLAGLVVVVRVVLDVGPRRQNANTARTLADVVARAFPRFVASDLRRIRALLGDEHLVAKTVAVEAGGELEDLLEALRSTGL